MRRTEYFETEDGQKWLYWKRLIKEMHFEVEQEPKTKKSLKLEDKRYFRKKIKEQLQKDNRRAYRTDIILEIDFYTTDKNPAPLQTLSKNYLDLLHKSMPDIDNYKSILFNDDSQIKILIANYHLNEYGDNKSLIRIRTNTLTNFYEDISLADRILRNDFNDKDYSNNYKFEDYLRDEDLDDDTDAYNDYKELKNNKEQHYKTFGEQYYLAQEYLLKKELQERYLHINRISINDLINLYQSEFIKNKKYDDKKTIKKIFSATKNYVYIASDFFDLGEAPTEEGESTIFKEHIRKKLNLFREQKPILYPFLLPISIIVLFTPPERNIIDLDNLARRYIVSFITEILKPPASNAKVLENYEFYNNQYKINQKYHPYSLKNYQLLHLPREENSPVNGEIKFVITNGDTIYKNIKDSVYNLINKWEE